MIRLGFTFLLVCFTLSIYAQQYPLFTNFVTNKFGYNPAVAGCTPFFDTRFVYRKQWAGFEGAPETQIFSGHGKLPKLPIGLGGILYNDEAGALKRTGFSTALSLVQEVGEKSAFSIGFSGGFYRVRLNDNFRADTPSDLTLANAQDGVWTPDFSAGIYYHSGNFYTGFSIPQVFERKINFDNPDVRDNSTLVRHYYFMVGNNFRLSDNFEIEPAVLLKLVEAAPAQMDFAMKIRFYQKLWVGASFRTDDAITALAGFDVGDNFTLSYAYDFTTSPLNEYSSGTHEITVGFMFGKKKDTDGDGVPDKEDKCPEVPGPAENDGCPDDKKKEDEEDENDKDGDGIPDDEDDCPELPGLKEDNGCPFGDRDGDGIRDDIDKCPDIPGVLPNSGCPFNDRDGDGLKDEIDKCPDFPGTPKAEGCPIEDTDGDGIVNEKDACPNTYGPVTNNGCPVVTPQQKEIVDFAFRNLYFEFDKAVIQSVSFPYLDRLAELMLEKKDWDLKLEGHTDSRGSREYNLRLSKRRALAVKNHLVSKGVEGHRVIVEYYGETRPVAPNLLEEGRTQNRRVEMDFVFN